MHRTIKVLALSALAMLGFAFNASAQQKIPSTVCDQCTTTQMDRAVVTYARANLLMGVPTYVYVFNPTNDIVRKYDVLVDYDGDPTGCGSGGPANINCSIVVLKTLVPAEPAASQINVAFRAMGYPITSIQLPGPNVDPSLPQNPYEDITQINKQYAVDSYIKNMFGTTTIQSALALASTVGAFESQPAYILIYPTGGRVQYQFDTVSMRWIPIVGSRTDADGNTFFELWSQVGNNIPGATLVIPFAGSAQTTINNYLLNLQRIGIPVTGSYSTAPQKKLVCAVVSAGSADNVTKECHWI